MDMSESDQLETLRSAADVWATLEAMYFGAGSAMRMMETGDRKYATVQKEKMVHQYVSKLKCLWADLDPYSRLSLE